MRSAVRSQFHHDFMPLHSAIGLLHWHKDIMRKLLVIRLDESKTLIRVPLIQPYQMGDSSGEDSYDLAFPASALRLLRYDELYQVAFKSPARIFFRHKYV